MLDQIKALTDASAMTRLLHETIAYERSIDEELENMLSQRHELEKKVAGLHKTAEVLEIVRADADQMFYSVRSTCALADLVSGKVRELDMAQSRVQETLSRIDAIVDRGSCIDGAKNALEAEDYEGAAKCVEKFLQLDEKIGEANAMTEQRKQLLDSKQKLENVIRKKLSIAVDARDHEGVVRFVNLFAPLGLQEEGLHCFVNYLRKVIALRARDQYEQLKENSEQADYVGVLNDLFKDIALAIEENEELIRMLGTEDALVYVIKELQEECDARGSVIVKKYIEYRKLVRVAKEISVQQKSSIPVTGNAEGGVVDPREIEIYLEEMQLLIQTSEDYLQFMMSRVREAGSAGSAGAQLNPGLPNSFRSGSFNRAVQEVANYYLILEDFFMVENVKKAIKIDEFVVDTLTTSVVDDVFYVLQSCTARSVSTSNIQLVLSVVNCAANLLNNEYKDALQKKFKEWNLSTKLFAGGVGNEKIGRQVAAALNNMDVSAEYVLKLKHEIEDACHQTFSGTGEREKLKTCLTELEETSVSLRQLTNVCLEQLANSITPRLWSSLDALSTVSYELTEAEYAENEVNDPWVQKLVVMVADSINWLQVLLSNNNYESLVQMMIEFVTKRIEIIMKQKRLNQLGGLQLDRDVRTLVGLFSNMSQRSVRDKFGRLIQIATILNLEKVSEILDFWGENSGPTTWRLTPEEVRHTLRLRVDFKREAIDALKL